MVADHPALKNRLYFRYHNTNKFAYYITDQIQKS